MRTVSIVLVAVRTFTSSPLLDPRARPRDITAAIDFPLDTVS
ncbi:hypothetical protein [Nocardia bovistercoris]|nr:hypothetical protein [Nocardia bovistercoris]